MMGEYKDVIIIKHPSGSGFFSYDILCKYRTCNFIDSNQGYKMNCRFVEEYVKEHPEFVYLFSEDNGHIPEFNWIENYVEDLISKGAVLVNIDNCKSRGETK